MLEQASAGKMGRLQPDINKNKIMVFKYFFKAILLAKPEEPKL